MKTSFKKAMKFSIISHLTHKGYLSGFFPEEGVVQGYMSRVFYWGIYVLIPIFALTIDFETFQDRSVHKLLKISRKLLKVFDKLLKFLHFFQKLPVLDRVAQKLLIYVLKI